MNIEQAKQIPIEVILKSMGIGIERESGNDIWFKSPFSPTEKSGSFHVSKQNGYWYCFSNAIGGCNGIDLVVKVQRCTVSDALKFLQDFDSSSFRKQIRVVYERKKEENHNYVLEVKPIEHIALKQYLISRGITKSVAFVRINEVHYKINEKNYFALGFQNKSQGWEIRSKYAKICLGKKDISLILNESKTLRIYEGFFDYLTFIQIRENLIVEESDYLILNSVALLVKNISVLSDYDFIELYLDNDTTGDKYTSLIMGKFKNVKDCRVLFHGFKDLNECLVSGSEIKDRI